MITRTSGTLPPMVGQDFLGRETLTDLAAGERTAGRGH